MAPAPPPCLGPRRSGPRWARRRRSTFALSVGLLCFLLAVSKGATWGWTAASTLGCFVVAVVTLGAWGWWELRTPDPLADLRTTVRPQVLLTNVASIFTGIGMYATMLITPQILMLPTQTGYGLGQSMLAAGLWMLPGGLIQVFLSPVGGKLIDSRGAKFTLAVGATVIALGHVAALFLMGTAPGLMTAHMITRRVWGSPTAPCRPSSWESSRVARRPRPTASTP
ncbi:hypothetical protein [Streptomyces abyssomicinicus]|uniref:hypothetical protein n=1 Tax=Streptomyces abyssomicinicus TaxID=574929 RepID=UPI0012504EDB